MGKWIDRLKPGIIVQVVLFLKASPEKSRVWLPSDMPRIAALDGLRSVAILLVMANHLLQPITFRGRAPIAAFLNGGWIGVDLFFVLSGFLVSGILFSWWGAANFLKVFYFRRATRILLPYYVFLVAVFLITPLAGFSLAGVPWLPLLTHTQPFWFAFHNTWTHPFLNPTWSLGIEEYFYLLIPAVLMLCGEKMVVRGCIALWIAMPIVRAAAQALDSDFYMATMVFRTDSLCAGVVLSHLWRTRPKQLKHHRSKLVLFWWGALALLIYYFHNILEPNPVFVTGILYPFLALFFFVTVALVLTAESSGWANCFLTYGPVRYLGRISYSVYLFHSLVYWVAVKVLGSYQLWVSLASGGLACLLASALWELYEKNLVEWGRSRSFYRMRSSFA